MMVGGIMRRLNTYAADMIPTRLILSIVIIAAILFIMVVASSNLRIILAEHQVEQQCHFLESSLSTMIASGVSRDVDDIDDADGTKRTLTFHLPDSLIYLSFGGDPDPMNSGLYRSGLTEDGASIFYRVEGGSKKVIWLPKETCKFREGASVGNRWTLNDTEQSYVVTTGGEITLIFERVQKNHRFYILIHGYDDIE